MKMRWWLSCFALWAVRAASAHAQLPNDPPPVPPDTAAVERTRSKPVAPAPHETPAKPAPVQTGAAPVIPVAPGLTPPLAAPPAPEVKPPDVVHTPPEGPRPQPPPAAAELPPPPPAAVEDTTPIPPPRPESAAPAPPPPAAALPPPPAATPPGPWSAAVLLGLGSTFDKTTGGVNPLGFGFGLRGEYRLQEPWTVGARVQYYVGGSSDLPTGRVSMLSWLVALEGSYMFRLEPLLIQPGMLLGVYVRDIDERPAVVDLPGPGFAPGSQNHSWVGFYLAPGVSVTVPLSVIARDLDHVFFGMDMRLDLAFGKGVTSNLQLMFEVGVRF